MPLAGLVVDIGAWVVLQVTKDLAVVLASGQQAQPIAVGISARQCQEPRLQPTQVPKLGPA